MKHIGEYIPDLMAELRANMVKAGKIPPPAEDTMNTTNTDKPAGKAFKRPSIKSQVRRLLRESEDCGVTSSARLLLLALYGYSNDRGWCWPGHAQLGTDTGLAERTIRKALTELNDAGLVRTAKPGREMNGAKGYFGFGTKKLPRGRSVYLVWSLAPEDARAAFARLVNPRAQTMKEPAEGRWFRPDEKGGNPLGPYTTAQVTDMIARGDLSPRSRVWCQSIGDWSAAVDIPTLAGYFTRAA